MYLREARSFLVVLPVLCAKHQRALTVAIKRARHVALMPYVAE